MLVKTRKEMIDDIRHNALELKDKLCKRGAEVTDEQERELTIIRNRLRALLTQNT